MFKSLRVMQAARARMEELVKGGADPYDAAETVTNEAVAKGIDPATLATLLAFIQFIITTFFKKP